MGSGSDESEGLSGMLSHVVDDMLLEARGSVSVHSLLMPWEHGPLAEVFKNASPCVPTVTQPASLSVPQEASSLEQAHSIAMPPAMGVRVFYSGFVSKLVFPKPVDSQADNLHLIAQRYELLIAHDYDASSLGKTIKDLMSGLALFLRPLEAKLSPPCARGLVSCLEW